METETKPATSHTKRGKSAPPPPPPSSSKKPAPTNGSVAPPVGDGGQQPPAPPPPPPARPTGPIELTVLLPAGNSVTTTVDSEMAMMDLVVQLAVKNKLSPSGHTLAVPPSSTNLGSEFITYKPNTRVADLGVTKLQLVPKNQLDKKTRKTSSFEQTERLTVHYGVSRKLVVRVNPDSALAVLLPLICQHLDMEEQYISLRLLTKPDQDVNLKHNLNYYKTREIILFDKREPKPELPPSMPPELQQDFLGEPVKEKEKKKRSIFGFGKKNKHKFSPEDKDDQSVTFSVVSAPPAMQKPLAHNGAQNHPPRPSPPPKHTSYEAEDMHRPGLHASGKGKRQAPKPPPATEHHDPLTLVVAPVVCEEAKAQPGSPQEGEIQLGDRVVIGQESSDQPSPEMGHSPDGRSDEKLDLSPSSPTSTIARGGTKRKAPPPPRPPLPGQHPGSNSPRSPGRSSKSSPNSSPGKPKAAPPPPPPPMVITQSRDSNHATEEEGESSSVSDNGEDDIGAEFDAVISMAEREDSQSDQVGEDHQPEEKEEVSLDFEAIETEAVATEAESIEEVNQALAHLSEGVPTDQRSALDVEEEGKESTIEVSQGEMDEEETKESQPDDLGEDEKESDSEGKDILLEPASSQDQDEGNETAIEERDVPPKALLEESFKDIVTINQPHQPEGEPENVLEEKLISQIVYPAIKLTPGTLASETVEKGVEGSENRSEEEKASEEDQTELPPAPQTVEVGEKFESAPSTDKRNLSTPTHELHDVGMEGGHMTGEQQSKVEVGSAIKIEAETSEVHGGSGGGHGEGSPQKNSSESQESKKLKELQGQYTMLQEQFAQLQKMMASSQQTMQQQHGGGFQPNEPLVGSPTLMSTLSLQTQQMQQLQQMILQQQQQQQQQQMMMPYNLVPRPVVLPPGPSQPIIMSPPPMIGANPMAFSPMGQQVVTPSGQAVYAVPISMAPNAGPVSAPPATASRDTSATSSSPAQQPAQVNEAPIMAEKRREVINFGINLDAQGNMVASGAAANAQALPPSDRAGESSSARLRASSLDSDSLPAAGQTRPRSQSNLAEKEKEPGASPGEVGPAAPEVKASSVWSPLKRPSAYSKYALMAGIPRSKVTHGFSSGKDTASIKAIGHISDQQDPEFANVSQLKMKFNGSDQN